jgi:hypothetical protein
VTRRPEPSTVRHGTYAGYVAERKAAGAAGVCDDCRAAERQYQARRKRALAYGRPLKVPSIGSVRRLQALMANGWPGTYLAERLGVRRTNLPTHTRFPTIRTGNAQRIAELYDELRLQAGPSKLTLARAEMCGFLPPECWEGVDIDDPDALPVFPEVDDPAVDMDEVAVLRALDGDRTIILNVAERREAVRQLHARGLSDSVIAARIGAADRTVLRIRRELDLPANTAAA